MLGVWLKIEYFMAGLVYRRPPALSLFFHLPLSPSLSYFLSHPLFPSVPLSSLSPSHLVLLLHFFSRSHIISPSSSVSPCPLAVSNFRMDVLSSCTSPFVDLLLVPLFACRLHMLWCQPSPHTWSVLNRTNDLYWICRVARIQQQANPACYLL